MRETILFVSPSRHKSYGLTIAEAQAAGCRVISHCHYGASGSVVDCADASALAAAIAQGRTLKKTSVPCRETSAARQLAELLLTVRNSAESVLR